MLWARPSVSRTSTKCWRPWVGVPIDSWPGLDFTPGVHFWALLPAFVVVTLVGP